MVRKCGVEILEAEFIVFPALSSLTLTGSLRGPGRECPGLVHVPAPCRSLQPSRGSPTSSHLPSQKARLQASPKSFQLMSTDRACSEPPALHTVVVLRMEPAKKNLPSGREGGWAGDPGWCSWFCSGIAGSNWFLQVIATWNGPGQPRKLKAELLPP